MNSHRCSAHVAKPHDGNGKLGYKPASMSGHVARSWFLALRNRIAAALCVVIFLTAVHPAHAARQGFQVAPGPLAASVTQTGDEMPVIADAVVDHSVCQCECKTPALPAYPVRIAFLATSVAAFGMTLSAGSRPSAQAPPAEPPRT